LIVVYSTKHNTYLQHIRSTIDCCLDSTKHNTYLQHIRSTINSWKNYL